MSAFGQVFQECGGPLWVESHRTGITVGALRLKSFKQFFQRRRCPLALSSWRRHPNATRSSCGSVVCPQVGPGFDIALDYAQFFKSQVGKANLFLGATGELMGLALVVDGSKKLAVGKRNLLSQIAL